MNKNEVLSIAYDDAKELTDKDIFNMVSSFANMNNNGVSRSTSASFKITKRTYINKEGEFQNKEIASRTALLNHCRTGIKDDGIPRFDH